MLAACTKLNLLYPTCIAACTRHCASHYLRKRVNRNCSLCSAAACISGTGLSVFWVCILWVCSIQPIEFNKACSLKSTDYSFYFSKYRQWKALTEVDLSYLSLIFPFLGSCLWAGPAQGFLHPTHTVILVFSHSIERKVRSLEWFFLFIRLQTEQCKNR